MYTNCCWGGPRACSPPPPPPKIFDKNGVIWCNLGRSKVCYYNLKINNFKEKNQQENLIAIYLSQINLHKHVSTKINTFRIYQGGGVWGLAPQKQKKFLKKIKQNRGFSLFIYFFFLLFGKAPYIPKIMSLLPSSPKIISGAHQLPEINSHSPQIPKTPGGPTCARQSHK